MTSTTSELIGTAVAVVMITSAAIFIRWSDGKKQPPPVPTEETRKLPADDVRESEPRTGPTAPTAVHGLDHAGLDASVIE